MQFSELNGAWQEVPQWAEFLISFGYFWQEKDLSTRRIGLISMPCDSAAAGLVALGALRRFLEKPDANEIGLHIQRIRSEKNAILLHRCYPRWKFKYGGEILGRDTIVQVKKSHSDGGNGPLRTTFKPEDVRFQDEPYVQLVEGKELPNAEIYSRLVNGGGNIYESNLRRTYSGVCLAGRIMGENKTREAMSGIRMRSGTISEPLDKLLSIYNWSGENVSRTSFFNCRTKKRDLRTGAPVLVVADGDRAFLTVLDHHLFGQSDVVATIDRTLERNRLETIDQKVASLSQWYIQEESLPENFPAVPKGISIAIWRKR